MHDHNIIDGNVALFALLTDVSWLEFDQLFFSPSIRK